MNLIDIFSFIIVLGAAVAGGFYPLTRREAARSDNGFPHGEAFTSGVFLALSLVIMLPAGLHLFGKAYPVEVVPYAIIVAIVAFIALLAIEQAALRKKTDTSRGELTPPSIPIIMTTMIIIPSFLLGTALSLSETENALFILAAILAHKSSAGFGLALTMVRSRLSVNQTYLLYGAFALSTPIGILVGANAKEFLSGDILLVVKATILSIASGVFLYMATLHEFSNAPFIRHCKNPKCFLLMLCGLILTIFVKVVLELGHAG